MEIIVADKDKHNASAKITVTNAEDKDRLLKSDQWFGGRRHRVDSFVDISTATLCPTCSYWGHLNIYCPNPDKSRCQLCAGPHTTSNYKCRVHNYRGREGKGAYCVTQLLRLDQEW